MITRKQYPNHHVFETSIGGRPFTVETGKVAELADARVHLPLRRHRRAHDRHLLPRTPSPASTTSR